MAEDKGMKRPREEGGATISMEGLSKTERRRLAKKAKKEREASLGVKRGKKGATKGVKAKEEPKPKITKEERRLKYTKIALEKRDRKIETGQRDASTRCLGCRKWGHILAACTRTSKVTGMCFNCGSLKHALRACPHKKGEDGQLPHATCFVCGEKGHISAQCKQNANGIYPKGGSCKECGSKHHLWSNCPHRENVTVKKSDTREADTEDSESTGTASPGEKVKPEKRGKQPHGGHTRADRGDDIGQDNVLLQKMEPEQDPVGHLGDVGEGMGSSPGHAQGIITKRQLWGGGDDLEGDDYFALDDSGDGEGTGPSPPHHPNGGRLGSITESSKMLKSRPPKVVSFWG